MMNKRISSVFLALGCVSLVVGLIIFSAYFAATDSARYIAVHETVETDTGLTPDGVRVADLILAGYLRGNGSLDYTDEVNGTVQRVFNDREIAHMADVKALFDAAKAIGFVALAAGLVFCALSAILNIVRFFTRLFKTLIIADVIIVLLLGVCALFIANDFSGAFLGMHDMLFSNDLWMLNPQTDLMIRLLPEEFFSRIAVKTALAALGKAGYLAGISAILYVVFKRKEK